MSGKIWQMKQRRDIIILNNTKSGADLQTTNQTGQLLTPTKGWIYYTTFPPFVVRKRRFFNGFCKRIYGKTGWQGIGRGYADHPAGTSNIITNDTSCEKTYHKEHPEKSGCFLNELFWKGEKKCAI